MLIKLIHNWIYNRFGKFGKSKRACRFATRIIYASFYPTHKKGLENVLAVTDILIKENENEDKYSLNKATLVLISKAIQHLESVIILVENGLYGDAWICIRSILSDMKMLEYLQCKPELVEKFLKESKNDYQDKKSGFSSIFSEGAVDRELKNLKGFSDMESFQMLSKALHASALGAQFYGTYGNGNKYHLKYKPAFEKSKADAIFAIISATHSDFVNLILNYRSNKKLSLDTPEWRSVIKVNKKIEKDILKFSNMCHFEVIKDSIKRKAVKK